MVIFALSGSLRKESSSKALLRTMKTVVPAATEVLLYEGLAELPHFSPDLDKENAPLSVQELRGMVNRSHAIVIATPEYAHGVPGSLKNALDWLVSTTVLDNKPVALLLHSSGPGIFAKEALTEVLRTMNARVLPELSRSVTPASMKADDPGTWQELKSLLEDLTLAAKPRS